MVLTNQHAKEHRRVIWLTGWEETMRFFAKPSNGQNTSNTLKCQAPCRPSEAALICGALHLSACFHGATARPE